MPRFDKLLVLDLDETLLHAADSEDDVGRAPDHRLFDQYPRPQVRPGFPRPSTRISLAGLLE